MIKVTDNVVCKFQVDKELFYVTGESGNRRRYHLLHIGFDRYKHPDSDSTAWTFNITLPFVSMYIGYIFRR